MKRLYLLVLLAALALPFGVASARASGTGNLVVAEIFTTGGTSGAPYANDYVVLVNRGTASVSLGGWTLQTATSTGTSWSPTTLAGSIPADGHYLVQLASSGANGASLPAPEAIGTANLSSSGGKVAIVRNATALTCGASVGSCSAVSSVEDLVGWGTATDYEGSGAAPAPATTTAIVRAGGGCTDTDSNAADFATAAPNPRNGVSAAAACGVSGGGDGNVEVDVQPVLSLSLSRATLNFAGLLPGATPAPLDEGVTVTSNDASGYSLSVHRTAFSPSDLPLGIGVTLPAGATAGAAPTDGSLAAVPIAPAADLVVGSTAAATSASGDAWSTHVGFVSPLPFLPTGHYTATITYTAIGL